MPCQERGTPKRKTFVSQTGGNDCAQDGPADINSRTPYIDIYEYILIYVYVHTRPYIYTYTYIDIYVYVHVCVCVLGFSIGHSYLETRAPQVRGLAHCQYGTTLGRPRIVSQSPGLTLLPFSPIKVFPVACRLSSTALHSPLADSIAPGLMGSRRQEKAPNR